MTTQEQSRIFDHASGWLLAGWHAIRDIEKQSGQWSQPHEGWLAGLAVKIMGLELNRRLIIDIGYMHMVDHSTLSSFDLFARTTTIVHRRFGNSRSR